MHSFMESNVLTVKYNHFRHKQQRFSLKKHILFMELWLLIHCTIWIVNLLLFLSLYILQYKVLYYWNDFLYKTSLVELCGLKVIYTTSANWRTTPALLNGSFSIFKKRFSGATINPSPLIFLFYFFPWCRSWLHLYVIARCCCSTEFKMGHYEDCIRAQSKRHREAQHTRSVTHQRQLRRWSARRRKERRDGVACVLWICILVVRKLIIVTASHSRTHTHTDTSVLMFDNFQVSSQL